MEAIGRSSVDSLQLDTSRAHPLAEVDELVTKVQECFGEKVLFPLGVVLDVLAKEEEPCFIRCVRRLERLEFAHQIANDPMLLDRFDEAEPRPPIGSRAQRRIEELLLHTPLYLDGAKNVGGHPTVADGRAWTCAGQVVQASDHLRVSASQQ